MEKIDVGLLSIIPSIIAIILALLTRQVISSLVVGILAGTGIYVAYSGDTAGTNSFIKDIILVFEYTFNIMADKFDIMMIIFLCLLGSLVAVITLAGGARSYGEWASKKVKSVTGAKLATSTLGLFIFIDDYFNCLTVGTVMRPVTDKYKISREKLAYLIDAMAAPICIIAPISSWAASIISYFPEERQADGIALFMQIIPFNFYALLTIIMVLIISIWKLDFGPMAKYEYYAKMRKNIAHADKEEVYNAADDELTGKPVSNKGKVFDLIIPIAALIIFSTLAMLYTGGYFFTNEPVSLFKAFGDTDPIKSLILGGAASLIVAFLLFVPRGVLSFKNFMDGFVIGVKAMASACIILTLAWTIKGVCDILSTGLYVSHLVETSNMPVALIPVIVFVVSGLLSFSLGTSWGTFGILIPIMFTVSESVSPDLLVINLAATLAGSIFGDHCSPISDTTVLSATGAGCSHIDHFVTQLPYAILVALCSLTGFVLAGFTKSLILSFSVSLILLVVSLIMLNTVYKKKYSEKDINNN